MLDADNVNVKPWNLNNIKKYLKNDNWDSLSFNRDRYYDIWALLYENFKYHCWGYNDYNSCRQIKNRWFYGLRYMT